MERKDIVLANGIPFSQFPDSDTEYGLDLMADTEKADKIIFFIDSTLNQAVTVQAIAARDNAGRNLAQAVTVGGSISVAAGNTTPQNDSMTLNLVDNFHFWLGVSITTGGTAPRRRPSTTLIHAPLIFEWVRIVNSLVGPDEMLKTGRYCKIPTCRWCRRLCRVGWA